MVFPIVYEEEREEGDMVLNLRVGFRERQHKHMSESIAVSHSPSKIPCPDAAYQEPASAPIPVTAHLTAAVKIISKSDEKLHSIEDIAHHEPRRLSINPDHFSVESLSDMVSSFSRPKLGYVPSREEIAELIRQIFSFTKRETPVQYMGVLFSTTQQIPIEIENNSDRSFTTHLSYSTPNTVISRIMPMWDYTSFETK